MAILSQANSIVSANRRHTMMGWKVQRPDGSYPNASGEGKGRVQFSKPTAC